MSRSDIGSRAEFVNSEGLNGNLKSDSRRVSISEDDNECQEGEGKEECVKPRSGYVDNEQEPGPNGENAGQLPRKVCNRKLADPV